MLIYDYVEVYVLSMQFTINNMCHSIYMNSLNVSNPYPR